MKRILLVDDNSLFREGLALLLKWNIGLDSVQAESLAEARRILGNLHDEVGLAIVDIDLPRGDGIKLIEELCEVETQVSVLALTTSRNLQRYTSALEAGAEEVLTIATPIERIVDAIRQLAGGVETGENNIWGLV